MPREMLYIADEVFFVGTAAEITPIRSVDKIQVGAGRRGPITTALQQAFFDYINGVVPDRHGWLTPVEIPTTKPEPAAAGRAAQSDSSTRPAGGSASNRLIRAHPASRPGGKRLCTFPARILRSARPPP